MPHVSKQKLNTKLYSKLFSDFVELQTGLTKKQATASLMSLLTETEQVMLTKRCAAAIMYESGCSLYEVWLTLNISKSTAVRLRQQYDEGVFDGLLKSFTDKKRKQKEREEFFETLSQIMRLGMPSRGNDRWKSLKL